VVEKFSQPHNAAAIVFASFWLVTVAESNRSLRTYLYITPVVVVYWLFTFLEHHKMQTNIEWYASGLVWYHLFSVIFFLPGGPLKVNRRLSG
jgi:hypothetical protein